MLRKTTVILGEERGFVLVLSMLILMLLVVVGVTAISTSTIEVQIAGSDKFYQMAFNVGDSGIYTTPKVIGRALDELGVPVNPNFSLVSAKFYNQVMGFEPPPAPGDPIQPDLEFSMANDVQASVNILRTGSELLPGGGVEFGSGAEGVGPGSVGGVQILFSLDSLGTGPRNTASNIVAVYRRIPGTAGGL